MANEDRASTPRRVLVVDDRSEVTDMLAMFVRLAGYEVRTARDGVEAMMVAEEFLPDIILMDLEMPRLDGWEAARQMRRQAWGERVLLIAITGRGQDEDRQRTREVGFDLHLVKPLDMPQLQGILRHFKRG